MGEMKGDEKLISSRPGMVDCCDGAYDSIVVYTIGLTILAKCDFVNESWTIQKKFKIRA